MFQTKIYQMTPSETQFFCNANHTRFNNLLNQGINSPCRLSVQFHPPSCIPHGEQDGCFVVAFGLSNDQAALFKSDWVKERIRIIMSIMQSEKALMLMLTSKIVSQLMYLYSTSQFLPLILLLQSLQKKVKTDPREYERFGTMIHECERRQQLAQNMEDNDMDDDDYDEDEFKAMIYRPNNILPIDKLRLSPFIKSEIQWFCQKYTHREKLTAAGLPWGNRLLLAGPPGNGKTALACSLSKLLGLPIFIVNMGELRRSHIGETGHQMSILFQGLKHSTLSQNGKAVVFFDECDSVATHRIYEQGADKEDSASLNVLLTSLDQLDSETIVIAATNYPDDLDPAFKRRFSSYLWLAPPTAKAIEQFVEDYQKDNKIHFNLKELNQVASLYGKSWAKVTEFCQSLHTARIIGTSHYKHSIDWLGKESEKGTIGFRTHL